MRRCDLQAVTGVSLLAGTCNKRVKSMLTCAILILKPILTKGDQIEV